MQTGVLAGQEVAVDRLADERVAERVVALASITSTWLATASRAPSITSAGDSSATVSSSAWVAGRSTTAAIRTTAWAVGESRSTRAISTSRSVSGSSQLSPSSLAASSSSV